MFATLLVTETFSKVAKATPHPRYSYNLFNDDYNVAVIQTAMVIHLDGITTGAIGLPEQNEKVLAGTKGIIAGFGKTQNSNEPDNILRAVEVTVLDQKRCQALWDDYYVKIIDLTDRMFCAYARGQSPCIVMKLGLGNYFEFLT